MPALCHLFAMCPYLEGLLSNISFDNQLQILNNQFLGEFQTPERTKISPKNPIGGTINGINSFISQAEVNLLLNSKQTFPSRKENPQTLPVAFELGPSWSSCPQSLLPLMRLCEQSSSSERMFSIPHLREFTGLLDFFADCVCLCWGRCLCLLI